MYVVLYAMLYALNSAKHCEQLLPNPPHSAIVVGILPPHFTDEVTRSAASDLSKITHS